jgi:hypothetical protein
MLAVANATVKPKNRSPSESQRRVYSGLAATDGAGKIG